MTRVRIFNLGCCFLPSKVAPHAFSQLFFEQLDRSFVHFLLYLKSAKRIFKIYPMTAKKLKVWRSFWCQKMPTSVKDLISTHDHQIKNLG